MVKVKVMEVDLERKRIALSMRLNDKAEDAARQPGGQAQQPRSRRNEGKPSARGRGAGNGAQAAPSTALAAAFAKARSDS
ncbi:MAG TPA: hypothetical protein DD459_10670 [Halieaceae bacterium]|nr:hypothetical protein [Halieaceae bacterium]